MQQFEDAAASHFGANYYYLT